MSSSKSMQRARSRTRNRIRSVVTAIVAVGLLATACGPDDEQAVGLGPIGADGGSDQVAADGEERSNVSMALPAPTVLEVARIEPEDDGDTADLEATGGASTPASPFPSPPPSSPSRVSTTTPYGSSTTAEQTPSSSAASGGSAATGRPTTSTKARSEASAAEVGSSTTANPVTTATTRPAAASNATRPPKRSGDVPLYPAAGPIAPYADAPACPTHDKRAWHSLWDGERGCHYDHEHHDDPHEVDDVFGDRTWEITGGNLSYPWQTFSDHGGTVMLENDMKHEGYKWLVRTDEPCFSQFSDGCITDFRASIHAISGAMGATTRFHSYYIEARACRESDPSRCGIFRTGGWIDTGALTVDGERVVLPGDPPDLTTKFRRRMHGSTESNTGQRYFMTWYMGSESAGMAIMTPRSFGPLDRSDLSNQVFHCDLADPDCHYNGSTMEAHLVGFRVPEQLDTDGDGFVTHNGYTDRYGNEVDGCIEVGLDCVPYEFVDVPVGGYQFRDDGHGMGNDGRWDYDIAPDGASWITFPN